MSYKIDPEKGFKILRCISPPIILVNGPLAVGKSTFVNNFKREGFSILNINEMPLENIRKYLKNRKERAIDHNPVILEANIDNDKTISEIFDGEFHNFTYVYVYPNNAKSYKEHLTSKINSEKIYLPKNQDKIAKEIEQIKQSSDQDKQITKLTVELINLNKEIYNIHLETFEEKILTILV